LAAEYHGGLGMGFFDLGLGTKVHILAVEYQRYGGRALLTKRSVQ